MSNYNHYNSIEDPLDTNIHDDQALMSIGAMPQIWPANMPTSNKISSTSPTTPGTYYATINSTVSKRL